jgi:hypothetical protein
MRKAGRCRIREEPDANAKQAEKEFWKLRNDFRERFGHQCRQTWRTPTFLEWRWRTASRFGLTVVWGHTCKRRSRVWPIIFVSSGDPRPVNHLAAPTLGTIRGNDDVVVDMPVAAGVVSP